MLCLISLATLSLTATIASAAMHASPMMSRPAMTRPAPRFAPSTMTGTHRFFSDRFRRFHNNRTFIFVDSFGFPFFYPYPYYGYYPYAYYGYNDYGYGYGNANTVVELQRRLARAGCHRWDHGASNATSNSRLRTRPQYACVRPDRSAASDNDGSRLIQFLSLRRIRDYLAVF